MFVIAFMLGAVVMVIIGILMWIIISQGKK
jgi:hypothetical protein